MICQTPVVLVNVYAPNFDNALLRSLTACWAKSHVLTPTFLILGGDLNCAIDPSLDRSSPSTMARSFSDFMSLNGLADPWRYNNPQSRDYSFFSHVHHSFSRIDYFFIDHKLLPKVTSSEYLPIIISDHGPLTLDISLSTQPRTPSRWRFNSLLLSDAKFCSTISTAIDDFLFSNKTSSTSHSLLWESLKAYLRGLLYLTF